jgi:DNA-binding NtrC family response regulator
MAFGTIFADVQQGAQIMVAHFSDMDEGATNAGHCVWGPEINVLASGASWAWPHALRDIFRPRGVNLLVAERPSEFVEIIQRKRIHTTIVDMDSDRADGLATVKIIRIDYPLIPCILLTSAAGEMLLGKALRLDVFGVIDKPVDMSVLREQLHRLFIKKYNSNIFAEEP